MPQVVFTSNLRRHLDAPPVLVPTGTVSGALDFVFANNPRLRGYVLDDQGRLRRHVTVFVDGERAELTTPIGEESEVYVLQALSGG